MTDKNKLFILIIDGPMGAYKTTVGNLIHPKLKRTAKLEMDGIKWSISDFNRSKEDNAIVSDVVFNMTEEYLKHGVSVLLPQAFWKMENIQRYIDLSEKYSTELILLKLYAPVEELKGRLRNRPLPEEATSPLPEDRIDRNMKMWKDNQYDLGIDIDTSKRSSNDVAEEVENKLKSLGVQFKDIGSN